MSKTIEYKGYHTRVDYEDGELVGEVLGINDLIVFTAKSVVEFEKAFHESVDGYLEMCKQTGKTPDKEYSGQFVIRISPELHRRLALLAEQNGDSLNAEASKALSNYSAAIL